MLVTALPRPDLTLRSTTNSLAPHDRRHTGREVFGRGLRFERVSEPAYGPHERWRLERDFRDLEPRNPCGRVALSALSSSAARLFAQHDVHVLAFGLLAHGRRRREGHLGWA